MSWRDPKAVVRSVLALVLALAVTWFPSSARAASVGNALCAGEDVQFNPGNADDIIVPPGYKIEVFAKGLNFPTNIAFKGSAHSFEVYVTEAGTSLPGRCNAAVGYPGAAADNPFLADIRVLNSNGNLVRTLGRAPSVATREDPAFLHAPTIGITFERDFDGGRMFVSDSRQGIRGALGPKNSSRILEVDPTTGHVTERITGLPTGDHPTEQLTVRDGWLVWSQGSVTNSGIVGHDNTGPDGVGGPPDVAVKFQFEVPCQDVVLSGNNFDSGDGHVTGGYLPHGVAGVAGQVVHAFTGATQVGMCSGSILAAHLSDLQHSVRPISWGYRNPFGIRFAPDDHPLQGALLITENGEDERGARPANNSPDRLQVSRGNLDYHGWPDRFGFLNSTQAVFNPVGGPADDNAAVAVGNPVRSILKFPPQLPVAPLALEPADVAAVGLDFVPKGFAGGGNPGAKVGAGDALVTREGDFGFSKGNGNPEEGHDIERVQFMKDGRIKLERFAFNCRKKDQVTDADGRKRCTSPAEQAFADGGIQGINRPVDGKFGPDGAFYLVDFGAVRDFGRSDAGSVFTNAADAPLVQIPQTGVIWKISRIGGHDRNHDRDRDGEKDDD
jgi:glucose/arabinose dehydrogenase